MYKERSTSSDDRNNSDNPPMSRLFIICNKENSEEEIREHFAPFGMIEDIWIVKNKKSGDNKSVVYIKFSKTSEAAKAMEVMNGTPLSGSNRPIKVLVANSRHQGSRKYTENEEEKYLRLFVLIPRDMGEKELTAEFKRFGEIENVTIIRDKITKEGKGYGYVKFSKFSEAALAFENVDPKYKAVFAEPKPKNQSSGSDFYSNNNSRGGGPSHFGFNDFPQSMNSGPRRLSNTNDQIICNTGSGSDATLYVVCSPLVNQDQLWRLFDIVPGLDFCQINRECGRNGSYATVVYNSQQAASYAREKYHGLEYPPGERLIVKTGSEVKTIGNNNPDTIFPFNNNGSNSDPFCSVSLPPPQPMVDDNAPVARRCFIVCTTLPIPTNMLRNVFSRFGNLIDIYLLPNKNCGYAKYSNELSCQRAIETLHGAEICGTRIKVMEAEELGNSDDRRKRKRRDDVHSD